MCIRDRQGIGGDLRDLQIAARRLRAHIEAGDRGLKVEGDAEILLEKVKLLIENHKKDTSGEDALE